MGWQGKGCSIQEDLHAERRADCYLCTRGNVFSKDVKEVLLTEIQGLVRLRQDKLTEGRSKL